mmetsp:Transcript_103722/g.334384  ORF Transcript_103722/g.334384 Transcript_103722/m.334384 type:complete len:237 (-) Transcript_103722:111-821(-)
MPKAAASPSRLTPRALAAAAKSTVPRAAELSVAVGRARSATAARARQTGAGSRPKVCMAARVSASASPSAGRSARPMPSQLAPCSEANNSWRASKLRVPCGRETQLNSRRSTDTWPLLMNWSASKASSTVTTARVEGQDCPAAEVVLLSPPTASAICTLTNGCSKVPNVRSRLSRASPGDDASARKPTTCSQAAVLPAPGRPYTTMTCGTLVSQSALNAIAATQKMWGGRPGSNAV